MLQRVRRDRVLAAAQEGLSASWDHADDPWKLAALECLLWSASNFPTVTSEDVWARLEVKFPEAETHENSAMGGVFTTAAARGWIVSTGRRQQSTRETNHREITIWASRLYTGPDAVEVTSCPLCDGHGSLVAEIARDEEQVMAAFRTPRPVPPPLNHARPTPKRTRGASSTGKGKEPHERGSRYAAYQARKQQRAADST